MTKPSATAQARPPPPATSPATAPSLLTTFFARPLPLYLSAAIFRLIFLLYGLWQDANSPVKYTDIDYLVFTDAARFVSHGQSPYDRETYRYTPVLAWLLLPTAHITGNRLLDSALFSSGKILFALADLAAGWLLEKVLSRSMAPPQARKFATIWLLNPMVATISTRGSSEGLLGVLVMALLWAVLEKRITLAGLLLGFSVHFKIYPFIYAPAIIWWMDNSKFPPSQPPPSKRSPSLPTKILAFLTPARLNLTLTSLTTFSLLNTSMYLLYGTPFLQQTYLHHISRLDHRHNFSPYHTQLYLSSSPSVSPSLLLPIEKIAFLPQLLLSTLLIPLILAKKSLPTCLLAQTFSFVTFNKVCTSQYFLWYLILLPLYLPRSSFFRCPKFGFLALGLWVLAQAAWLQQGFELEFLGRSTFLPGLWMTGLGFFGVNCWILGVVVSDVRGRGSE
ncbi:family 50 putative glycosyltransferase [Triangularia verruculosa]|uniref:GPI mannosyltransferase 1 n=1 Tax=Triangularia verruculosa TaxID=2587418 RepID=A0AAN6XK02_9PEZI|nr:family 50 putative glycosyltransferase [Triangularia verruculosa]